MAMFMAIKIMAGVFDYSILDFRLYEKYRKDVDAILVSEGRSDLITHSGREERV